MDINTTYAIQKGWIPDRYLNQIYGSATIQENYISEKDRVFYELTGDSEDERTEINIYTTYEDNQIWQERKRKARTPRKEDPIEKIIEWSMK